MVFRYNVIENSVPNCDINSKLMVKEISKKKRFKQLTPQNREFLRNLRFKLLQDK